ncbi:MAG: type II toxin-antitoxin system RelE/ParE family toxin [Candidatus Bathyarchaeia archaeon]
MKFKVLLHPYAAKALQKLDQQNQERIKKSLKEVADDPYVVGEPLHPSDFWKTRTGDYRVIYQIDNNKKEVIVLYIGYGNNICDDFSKIL